MKSSSSSGDHGYKSTPGQVKGSTFPGGKEDSKANAALNKDHQAPLTKSFNDVKAPGTAKGH